MIAQILPAATYPDQVVEAERWMEQHKDLKGDKLAKEVDKRVLSPTFAAAKGLGPWDIQSTIGATLPTSGTNVLGRALIFNTAVDYRIKGKIWPMLEQNSTFWVDGPLNGNKQVFLTPGLVLGAFPLPERLHVGVGFGVQIAVTSFHQFNHRWILSLRFPF